MYCPTFYVNFCVLYHGLFHSNIDIVNMKDSISARFKRFKDIKATKFCTFVWYKILLNAYTTFCSQW